MLRSVKLCAVFVIPYIVVYLLGSFVAWSFHPAAWNDFGRFLAVIVATTLASILTSVGMEEMK